MLIDFPSNVDRNWVNKIATTTMIEQEIVCSDHEVFQPFTILVTRWLCSRGQQIMEALAIQEQVRLRTNLQASAASCAY